VAAAAATACALAAWLTGDWWVGGYEGAARNLTVARVLLFLAALGVVYAAPAVLRKTSRVQRLAFAGWAAYLGLWLLGQWPGLVEPDTTDAVVNARQGVAYEWFSYLNSLLYLAVLDVVPHVAALGVLQVTAMAALLAYATSLVHARSRTRWPVVAFCALAALSSPLVTYTIHYSRDTVFAILHVLLALVVARAVVETGRLSRAGLLGIVALVGFLSAYRGDGPVLVVVVGLLLLSLRPGRRAVLAGAGAFAAALVLFHVALPATLAIRAENPHQYGLTLRVNPLGAVLQSDFFSQDRDADLAGLSRVLDVDRTRALQVPVDIPAYWDGTAWRREATEADWQAFEAAGDRLLVDNLPTVVGNRVANFAASAGLGPGGWRGPEYIYDLPADRVRKERPLDPGVLAALTATPPVQRLYTVQEDLLHSTSTYVGAGLSGAFLHWNLLPWLAVLIAALLRFRRWRFEAVVAVILLSRVPLVIAVAPIAQFKYYNSVHLGGLVVLALLLARVRREHLRRLLPAR